MQDNIDIFQLTKPRGEFFKFQKVGDQIQGTYIDSFESMDGYGNEQIVYVLLDANKKVWNVGMKKKIVNIIEKMSHVKYGQIVGFTFTGLGKESMVNGMKRNPTKFYGVVSDPRVVDHEWLKEQEDLYSRFGASTAEDNKSDIDLNKVSFSVPEDAGPIQQNLPKTKAEPAVAANEAVVAIRNLAKTKGLTTEAMTDDEADKTISAYTGLPLIEENLTKIIIALTGYAK